MVDKKPVINGEERNLSIGAIERLIRTGVYTKAAVRKIRTDRPISSCEIASFNNGVVNNVA